jgi:hypothetical protein
MSQLMAEQVVTTAPRRGRLIGDEPVTPTASPIDFVSEDDLDWAENQSRTRHDATRLDAAFIGLAITLTAVVIAVAIGLFSRF